MYKRQIPCKVNSETIIEKLPFCTEFNGSTDFRFQITTLFYIVCLDTSTTLNAVSYTHLDVYKRQIITILGMMLLPFSACDGILEGIYDSPAASDSNEFGFIRTDPSDVYKRQGIWT